MEPRDEILISGGTANNPSQEQTAPCYVAIFVYFFEIYSQRESFERNAHTLRAHFTQQIGPYIKNMFIEGPANENLGGEVMCQIYVIHDRIHIYQNIDPYVYLRFLHSAHMFDLGANHCGHPVPTAVPSV